MDTVTRHSRRRFLATGAASTVALLALPAARTFGQQLPAVVSTQPAQVMQGFGAAGAWWPNDLVRFAPAAREKVADMLFGPDGIALSGYRYNIGGGGVGVTNPVRAPDTFLVEPGMYDWGKDEAGRLFLTMAAERGVPILIGFVNSAPSVWTTNSGSCGGSLVPGAEAAFAHYLVDIATHFRDAEGIRLSFLSPMNEPNYRFESCGQEGMSVPVEQRAPLVQALGRELAVRMPECRVTADESSRTGEHFMRDATQWLAVPGTAEYIAALAVHRYDYPNDLVLGLADALAQQYEKPLWSTELCCLDTRTAAFGQQFDPTIGSALLMANLMWHGMTVANDAAFHWWVACSSELGVDPTTNSEVATQANDSGWNDGLLYYDPRYADNGNQQIYPTKRFYAMGNFSRYVRPGARRHEVEGAPRNLRILAFEVPADEPAQVATVQRAPVQVPPAAASGPSRDWVVVVVNNASATADPTDLRLQLPRAARLLPTGAIETSAARDLEPVDLPSVSPGGLLTARVPAQSITTYVLTSS